MLIPAKKVVFEGLSREYYARRKELAASGFAGCIRLTFADFEGTIVYDSGRPVTALHECGTWMALGDELIAPLENKAVATDGSMAIYAVSRDLIDFIAGRKIASTVETETEPLLGIPTLVDNLLRDRSACIFKAIGPSWIGYAFIAAGRVIDAAFATGRESMGGDRATAALRQADGHAVVTMYFLEGGAPFVEATPPVPAPEMASPVEAIRPPEPGTAPAATVTAEPALPAVPPAAPEVEVTVVLARDPKLQPRHPSKLATLEMLEDRSVVLVDGTTLEQLGLSDGSPASLILSGDNVAQITVLLMDLSVEPGKFAVVPRKLRRRLSVVPGTIVTLRPGSALVPAQ